VAHTIETMTLVYMIATMALNINITFHTIVAFVSPIVALLTSMLIMWHKEHLWNFGILQICLSILKLSTSNVAVHKAVSSYQ
jgi:hypothetical protein